ncbi:hypothetical protein DH2020_041845 [Rehmannia glutinosa]|uniref:Uncharacterized protein n=1 Tax=Rehmannia glutinosa TaxID=99300 RepID=A0ABR0UR46_REHGL
MVATNSMGTRSSLELMLDKIQQLEDQPKDIPPALPVRPVSRARLPRARKPLQLDFQRRNFEENDASFKLTKKDDFFESFHEDDIAESNGIELLEKNPKDVAEKGVSNIQKCYRGYQIRCYYKELRSGVIALQSFIRGENARRDYQYRSRSLKAIILIQKQARKYIKQRTTKTGPVEDAKDCTQVPYSVLIDLRKRVLRTEAKVREKKEENVSLKMQLQEMEKKWQQSEERMKSLEKTWQDQLTNIQERLAAGKKNRTSEIRFGQSDSTTQRHYNQNSDTITIISEIPNRRSLDFSINSIYHHQRELVHGEDSFNHNEVGVEQCCHKLHPLDELRKLKLRFKAWKKDYKNKLRDAQSMFKKLGNSETVKGQKSWWGRISH